MDKITLERIKTAHPLLVQELGLIYSEICSVLNGKAICRFAYVLRTFEEQTKIFNQKPKVTNAKAGQSYHNYGLAVDVVLLVDNDHNKTHETASWDFATDFDGDGKADWEEIDAIFKKYGWEGLYNKRGKRWDLPHFQKTFGYTWQQLLEMHNAKKFIKGTTYVDIKA